MDSSASAGSFSKKTHHITYWWTNHISAPVMIAETPSYMFISGTFAPISSHWQDLSINRAKHVAQQPFCTKTLRGTIPYPFTHPRKKTLWLRTTHCMRKGLHINIFHFTLRIHQRRRYRYHPWHPSYVRTSHDKAACTWLQTAFVWLSRECQNSTSEYNWLMYYTEDDPISNTLNHSDNQEFCDKQRGHPVRPPKQMIPNSWYQLQVSSQNLWAPALLWGFQLGGLGKQRWPGGKWTLWKDARNLDLQQVKSKDVACLRWLWRHTGLK